MNRNPIATIEYESMVFGRNLAGLPGRTRRSGGILDQSAYTLLNLLQAGGPASIGDLSSITGLDASTLNRQTAALVRAGHAERISDPRGGVARKFRATAEGEKILNEEREASRAALSSITADWVESDRATFARLLERFNRDIEARANRTWPRPQRSR